MEVVAKCVIGDDRERLAAAIRLALSRSGIVILSGGLGPTEDDVTRDAVAQALDRKLIFHPEIAEALEQRFLRAESQDGGGQQAAGPGDRGRRHPAERSRHRSRTVGRKSRGPSLMLLPGPPHELKAMFERQCLPRLERIVPGQAIRTIFLRVTGMSESDLDHLIAPVYKKYVNPATTILAANGDLQIHLRARCATAAEADALLAEVAGPIELLLGDRVYSRNGDPLEAGRGEFAAQSPCHGGGGGKLRPAECWASVLLRCRAARTISRAASSPTPTP